MKKLLLLLFLMILLIVPLCADSFSFSTGINSISGGDNGFGMGLFPLGTDYSFSRSFKAIKDYKYNMTFYSKFVFSLRSNSVPGYYSYKDGTPRWALSIKEYKDKREEYIEKSIYVNNNWYNTKNYYNPYSLIYTYIQQGFGDNPVGSGQLINLRLAWYTRYSMALEYNGVFNSYDDYTVFIDKTGAYNSPFGPGTSLPGYPWLQDNHLAWNNHLELAAYWYLYKNVGSNGARNGVYAETSFKYGPSWLGNTISPKGVSSNFWNVYGYLEERLVLFSKKQDNGMNWANMYIGHSNTASYVGGDVVPEHMMPTDRLRGRFSDKIWITFTGPQFVANDCYSYIELSLNNHVYLGHVANETSNSTVANELQSSVSAYFHLRLFGFIRFDYSFSYTFNRGIWSKYPSWSQGAQVKFYVSV